MSKTKKFGIGHGVTIVADHYGIRAEWFTDEAKKCRRSIGISWPVNPPDQVEIIWSLSGTYYYPRAIAKAIHGFWMSTETYPTEDAAKDAAPHGLFGKCWASFTNSDGTTYYRVVLHFNGWSMKSASETTLVSKNDPLVLDYAGIVSHEWAKDEARFNDAIEFTGRTARDIISKIYPFEDEPEAEDPVIPI